MAKKEIVITNPDSPMSKGQSYAIYCMVGIDVRNVKLTKGQASEVIDAINGDHAYHVRLKLVQAGGRVAMRDVNKKFRDNSKPRGYNAAMAKVQPDEKPKPKAKRKEETQGFGLGWLGSQDDDDDPEPKPKPKAKTRNKDKPKTKAEEMGLEDIDFNDPQVKALMKAFGVKSVKTA